MRKKATLGMLVVTILLVVGFGLAIPAFADPSPGSGPTEITNPLGNTTLPQLVAKVVEEATNIGFYVAVFFIIYSGFLFVKARGNDKELPNAKNAFLWTVIGTAVLLGANILARAVQGTIDQLGEGVSYQIHHITHIEHETRA